MSIMPASSSSDAYHTMSELPADTRPRERLARLGPESLSDAELLAILLRNGAQGINVLDLASTIVRHYGNDLRGLAQASLEELQTFRGMGEAKAAQILAARELGRRIIRAIPLQQLRVTSPSDVADLLAPEMAYADQELVKVVLVDTRNNVIAYPTVCQGSLNSAHLRIGEIFRDAIRRNAAALIIAHNHPSGDPTPSPEDVALTRQIVEAGRLLGIDVLDHLVLGHAGKFVSLKERRLGFS